MRTGERGFTYLLLLFLLAIGAAGLAHVAEREQTLAQREREAELRFRGEAIASAIERYAALGALPQTLDDLLEDRRGAAPRHLLRSLYADPFTGSADWEPILGELPVQADEAADPQTKQAASVRGIVGVRSRSDRRLNTTQWPQRAQAGTQLRAADVSFVGAGLTPAGQP